LGYSTAWMLARQWVYGMVQNLAHVWGLQKAHWTVRLYHHIHAYVKTRIKRHWHIPVGALEGTCDGALLGTTEGASVSHTTAKLGTFPAILPRTCNIRVGELVGMFVGTSVGVLEGASKSSHTHTSPNIFSHIHNLRVGEFDGILVGISLGVLDGVSKTPHTIHLLGCLHTNTCLSVRLRAHETEH